MPRPDVDVRAVAWTGLAIAVTIVVVVCAVFVLLHFWQTSPGADRLRLPYTPAIEGARLESAPQPELRGERAAKARLLTTTGWVDAAHGIVRIPIATAMRVVVAQGSAAVATTAVPTASAPASSPSGESGSTR